MALSTTHIISIVLTLLIIMSLGVSIPAAKAPARCWWPALSPAR